MTLLTERALQKSETSAEQHLHQIEACTSGLIFLGTPHSGSDFAPFAKSVAMVLKPAGKRVNTDILDVLKRESQTLLDVEDWLGRWLRRRSQKEIPVEITCFYEEQESPCILVALQRSLVHLSRLIEPPQGVVEAAQVVDRVECRYML